MVRPQFFWSFSRVVYYSRIWAIMTSSRRSLHTPTLYMIVRRKHNRTDAHQGHPMDYIQRRGHPKTVWSACSGLLSFNLIFMYTYTHTQTYTIHEDICFSWSIHSLLGLLMVLINCTCRQWLSHRTRSGQQLCIRTFVHFKPFIWKRWILRTTRW